MLFALACLHSMHSAAQQPAPPGDNPATVAAKRFPQPVRVGDLFQRNVLQPTESRQLLGHVLQVVRLDTGSTAVIIKFGATWGIGGRDIAVPVDALGLLGDELEVLDLTLEQLRARPTYGGGARVLEPDEVIDMGLARPSH